MTNAEQDALFARFGHLCFQKRELEWELQEIGAEIEAYFDLIRNHGKRVSDESTDRNNTTDL